MKKRIEYKIKDNDLDKVSGGGAFRGNGINGSYGAYFHCQGCGREIGMDGKIKNGDVCSYCGHVQMVYPEDYEDKEVRII